MLTDNVPHILIDRYADPRHNVHNIRHVHTTFYRSVHRAFDSGRKMLNVGVTSDGTSLTVGTVRFYSFQMGPFRCYSSGGTSLTV